MESSTLFTLANVRGFRAGTVCAVYANRPKNEFIKPKEKEEAEENCIKTGIEAVKMLARIDKVKRERERNGGIHRFHLSKKSKVLSSLLP